MARFDIQSIDRLGITQEILTALAAKAWDLGAMEMHLHHTYVHIRDDSVGRRDIISSLQEVEGITGVHPVALLPTEVRERHLRTLVGNLPNPILQLDSDHRIVDLNEPGQKIFGFAADYLKGRDIGDVAGNAFPDNLLKTQQHVEIQLRDRSFVAHIVPIGDAEEDRAGTLIVLYSMGQVGQQISAIQGDAAGIIGKSTGIERVRDQIRRIARSDFPILITGETGTGKELVARACHNQSTRKTEPFLALNCAAIPENLLESELFGYAAGAFTGAVRGGKAGLVELAEGGTIFLDEIAEMSPYLQAKLLRFLQDYSYRRVGGDRELRADIRIISATHRDLARKVASGDFREDLYYRLNVLTIDVPPLRERVEDIPLLAQYFTKKAATQAGRVGMTVGASGMALLQRLPWPGNVRQLENVIFRAVTLSDGDSLDPDLLHPTPGPVAAATGGTESAHQDVPDNLLASSSLADATEAFERALLTRLWPAYPSTRKLGARLKVSHNKIALMLRKYGLGK